MGKSVLISMHSKYFYKIKNGKKFFEYRKSIFKNNDEVEYVFVYISSPVKKVVGYFIYSGFIRGNKETVWNITKEKSGVSKEEFFGYYKQKEFAYAIFINNFFELDNFVDLKIFCKKKTPPQNFYYLKNNEINWEIVYGKNTF